MRNSALFALGTLVVVSGLATPAYAEHPALRTLERVTVLASTHTDDGAALATGERRLTGPSRERMPANLEAREVAAEVRPYSPEIQRCYVDHLRDVRRAGRLALTLRIDRDGDLVSLAAAAPGLPSRSARRIEACIREALEPLRFPARRNDTTAVLPYYFQHTETPGGGPQLSCWNPKGCPSA